MKELINSLHDDFISKLDAVCDELKSRDLDSKDIAEYTKALKIEVCILELALEKLGPYKGTNPNLMWYTSEIKEIYCALTGLETTLEIYY